MSTQSICDEIKLKASSWNIEGAGNTIISQVNRAQNFLYSRPCALSLYKDPATGKYPLLATTAGQREYPIPSFTRTIAGVARTLRISYVSEMILAKSTGDEYAEIIATRQSTGLGSVSGTAGIASEEDDATWLFENDPGTTTDKYMYLGVIEPLQLTSAVIPLMVDLNTQRLLIEGALGYIEYYDYGRSDRYLNFEENLAPRWWADMAARLANSDRPTFTTIRKN